MKAICKLSLCAMTILFLSAHSSSYAQANFLIQPSGQATHHSCQSYALSVALAFKRDPNFNVATASDLRNTEGAIRAEIKKLAGTGEVTHLHVENGFRAYTKGAYILKIDDISESDIGDKVGLRSGVTNKESVPAEFLLGITVKDVALTSVTRIGKNSYESGHIITILGIDGPPNSSRSYLILNSGVKVKNKEYKDKNACEDGIPDDSSPYTALLSWVPSSDITFKQFGSKLKLWRIEKS